MASIPFYHFLRHSEYPIVQRITGNGSGDTHSKGPKVFDWSTGIYNPHVDVTKETTTLYASDRDMFLFLVGYLNPLETGLLSDGSPDLYFRRGGYCWNSEVGAKTLGIASLSIAFISIPKSEPLSLLRPDASSLGTVHCARRCTAPDAGHANCWRSHRPGWTCRVAPSRS